MACQREQRWLLAGVAPHRTSRPHQVLNLLFKKAIKNTQRVSEATRFRPSVLRVCALMAQGRPPQETGLLQPWRERRRPSCENPGGRIRHVLAAVVMPTQKDRRTRTDPRGRRGKTESVRSCKRRAPCASLAVRGAASGVEV